MEPADSKASTARRKKEQVSGSWGINSNKINRKIFIKSTNYVVFAVK
jgi:hypothetical protein